MISVALNIMVDNCSNRHDDRQKHDNASSKSTKEFS